MKVSYRNYPILKMLKDGNLDHMTPRKDDKPYFDLKGNVFLHHWLKNSPFFLKNINVISDPFQFACERASPKLLDLFNDIIINDTADLSVDGTFIFGGFVYMMHYAVKKGSKNLSLALYRFSKCGVPLSYYIENTDQPIEAWATDLFKYNWIDDKGFQDFDKALKYIKDFSYTTIILSLFKRYAEVETKELKPNSKLKTIDCKYVNDTDLHLTYLDSKWFTTLVKSDAFNVRGHFRLQPFGKEMKEHKLIWISEFTKTGYTAPARKLNQDNNPDHVD